jgi:hypothetical protein
MWHLGAEGVPAHPVKIADCYRLAGFQLQHRQSSSTDVHSSGGNMTQRLGYFGFPSFPSKSCKAQHTVFLVSHLTMQLTIPSC